MAFDQSVAATLLMVTDVFVTCRAGGRAACWSTAMLGSLDPPRLSLHTS